ncbi:MAG: hypothetical protein OXC61_04115 [Flavobacteriaceae bacterium]|nr:hypothetical protein [Flavobacteriaceae bacterium]
MVEKTNNIVPNGSKLQVTDLMKDIILDAPKRAISFTISRDFKTLEKILINNLKKYEGYIKVASLIEDPKTRGVVIEGFITGEKRVIDSFCKNKDDQNTFLTEVKSENGLGDYEKSFDQFLTKTDVKTKVLYDKSNPKAYNIDKFLEFMSNDKSVFMFFFVGLKPKEYNNNENISIENALINVFQVEILKKTRIQYHLSGRNSRGGTLLNGEVIKTLLLVPKNNINEIESRDFLIKLMEL